MHPDLGEWRHEAEGKKHGWRTWKLSHGTQNKGLNMSVRRTVLKPASQRRWPNAAAQRDMQLMAYDITTMWFIEMFLLQLVGLRISTVNNMSRTKTIIYKEW